MASAGGAGRARRTSRKTSRRSCVGPRAEEPSSPAFQNRVAARSSRSQRGVLASMPSDRSAPSCRVEPVARWPGPGSTLALLPPAGSTPAVAPGSRPRRGDHRCAGDGVERPSGDGTSSTRRLDVPRRPGQEAGDIRWRRSSSARCRSGAVRPRAATPLGERGEGVARGRPPAPRRRPTPVSASSVRLGPSAHESVQVPRDEAQQHAGNPTPPARPRPHVESVRCTPWRRARPSPRSAGSSDTPWPRAAWPSSSRRSRSSCRRSRTTRTSGTSSRRCPGRGSSR